MPTQTAEGLGDHESTGRPLGPVRVVFQLSWLLAGTPGGIGIAEWGWVGILVRYGFNASDAALLSIAFRIYLVIFSIIILSIVYFMCRYNTQRQDIML